MLSLRVHDDSMALAADNLADSLVKGAPGRGRSLLLRVHPPRRCADRHNHLRGCAALRRTAGAHQPYAPRLLYGCPLYKRKHKNTFLNLGDPFLLICAAALVTKVRISAPRIEEFLNLPEKEAYVEIMPEDTEVASLSKGVFSWDFPSRKTQASKAKQ